MAESQRRHPRFQVHLAVRYAVARDFVLEYAENLSKGGLFLAHAERLEPRQIVDVEIALPGAGTYWVKAEVAHLLTAERAAQVGRKPGAGLAIVESPPDFDEALERYLLRLGRRRDVAVLVESPAVRSALEQAGYHAQPLPAPAEILAMIARGDRTPVAVVVPAARRAAYAAALRRGGAEDLVVDAELPTDEMLALIDDRL